jgi:hypothetical protein
VNKLFVKHGNNGGKLTIDNVKIVKFVTRFFNNINNHIMEGLVPDSIPYFTPQDADPTLLQVACNVVPAVEIAALKVKLEALPLGTPARECVGKKQQLKPAAESRDYNKVGIFPCKE